MPDWLRYLCRIELSMGVLGLEIPPLSQDLSKLLQPAKSDRWAWPRLPQGILEPRSDDGEQYRGVGKMSPEERVAFVRIWEKPENEWTRHEHRFIEKILDREPRDKHEQR